MPLGSQVALSPSWHLQGPSAQGGESIFCTMGCQRPSGPQLSVPRVGTVAAGMDPDTGGCTQHGRSPPSAAGPRRSGCRQGCRQAPAAVPAACTGCLPRLTVCGGSVGQPHVLLLMRGVSSSFSSCKPSAGAAAAAASRAACPPRGGSVCAKSPKFLRWPPCPSGSWCPVVLRRDPGAQTALQLLAVPLITLCLTRRIRRKGLNFESASAVPAHRREKQLYPFKTGVIFHTSSNPSANLLSLLSPLSAPHTGRAGRMLPAPASGSFLPYPAL